MFCFMFFNIFYSLSVINPFKLFMDNAEKWSDILEKVLQKLLKHVWSFFNIIHERLKWFLIDWGRKMVSIG